MAEIPVEVDLNLKQNELKQIVIEQRTDFPAGAKVGRIIDRSDLQLYFRCFDATGDTTLASKWKSIGTNEKSVFFEAVDFDFNSSGSINIKNLLAGTRLRRVELIVDQVFDDSAATFEVGVPSETDRFMKTFENTLDEQAEYDTFPNERFAALNMVQFTINSALSTQGSGTVIITYSGDQ